MRRAVIWQRETPTTPRGHRRFNYQETASANWHPKMRVGCESMAHHPKMYTCSSIYPGWWSGTLLRGVRPAGWGRVPDARTVARL